MSFLIDLAATGRRIEGLRGALSQADFAARLGVDRKTVGTWERGERLLDTRALLVLWEQFDADPAWVLTGQGAGPSTLDAAERVLLDAYRACTSDAQRNLIQTAALFAAGGQHAATPNARIAPSIKVSSHRGHAAGRDVNVNTEGATSGKQGNLKSRGARGRA